MVCRSASSVASRSHPGSLRGRNRVALRIASRAVVASLQLPCPFGRRAKTTSTKRLPGPRASAGGGPRPGRVGYRWSRSRSDCGLRCRPPCAREPIRLASRSPGAIPSLWQSRPPASRNRALARLLCVAHCGRRHEQARGLFIQACRLARSFCSSGARSSRYTRPLPGCGVAEQVAGDGAAEQDRRHRGSPWSGEWAPLRRARRTADAPIPKPQAPRGPRRSASSKPPKEKGDAQSEGEKEAVARYELGWALRILRMLRRIY